MDIARISRREINQSGDISNLKNINNFLNMSVISRQAIEQIRGKISLENASNPTFDSLNRLKRFFFVFLFKSLCIALLHNFLSRFTFTSMYIQAELKTALILVSWLRRVRGLRSQLTRIPTVFKTGYIQAQHNNQHDKNTDWFCHLIGYN